MTGLRNILNFTSAGLDSVLVYRYDTKGRLTDFLTGTITNGDQYGNRGGVEFEMARTMPYNPAEPTTITQGGERDEVNFNWTASPLIRFTAEFHAKHMAYNAVLLGVKTWGMGAMRMYASTPNNPQYPNTAIILHQRASSLETTSRRQQLFSSIHILSCEMIPVGATDVTAKAESGQRYLITASSRNHTMWGESLNGIEHGTCATTTVEASHPYRTDVCSYRGNQIENQFFLPRQLPESADDQNITVFVNNVKHVFGVDYTLSTVTNSFIFTPGSIPGMGAVINAVYNWTESC